MRGSSPSLTLLSPLLVLQQLQLLLPLLLLQLLLQTVVLHLPLVLQQLLLVLQRQELLLLLREGRTSRLVKGVGGMRRGGGDICTPT